MKWINVLYVLLFLSVGLQAQVPVQIWSDDFNNYPSPNVTYGCDYINHININQMNGLYGSSHGSVSYLDVFPVFSSTLTASFEDGHGIVMFACGASRGEGMFFNVPGGIEANRCYRVSFDLSFAVPFGLNSSETDHVFRVALGNNFEDTELSDLVECCGTAPTVPQITPVGDVVLANLETIPDAAGTWEVAQNFYHVEIFINQPNNFDQLLFFPEDIVATPQGGTKLFLTMFDNLTIETYCPDELVFEDQLFIPSGEHRAGNIISRTSSTFPSGTDNNINFNVSTSFIASNEVLISPRTTVSLNQPSTQFLAAIEPCLLDNDCNVGGGDLQLNKPTGGSISNSEELKVYPNPTRDRLYIQMENLEAVRNIRIYDNQGIVYGYIETVNNGNQIEIDVNNLSPGIYFLRLIHNEEVITKSFVISR